MRERAVVDRQKEARVALFLLLARLIFEGDDDDVVVVAADE